MSAPTTPAPSPLRCGTLAGFATAVGVLLWALPGAGPSTMSVDGVLGWWTDAGTAAATIMIVRGLGLLVAGATLALALAGIAVASSRSSSAVRAWTRVAPPSMHRALAASVLAGSLHPAVVAAAEPPAPPVPVLADLGPAETGDDMPRPWLRDVGPAVEEPATAPADAVDAEDAEDRWTVATGDHLWRIAEETLADRGETRSDAAVTRYWLRLIEHNRAAIGDDPDLIHPGLVLTLPD